MRLVVACLLFVAASETATAQCGWVLLSKLGKTMEDGKQMLNEPAQWQVFDGFAHIQECRANGVTKLSRTAGLYRKQLGFAVDLSDRLGIFTNEKTSNAFTLEFAHFPGGFDPRK